MGCYGPFVEEYLAQFSRSQLLVTTLEQYKSNPKETLTKVFAHLGVRDASSNEWANILGSKKVTNQQGEHYKKLSMLPSTRALLQEFYGACNSKLANLLQDARFNQWTIGKPAI